jgi:hypothetical protein
VVGRFARVHARAEPPSLNGGTGAAVASDGDDTHKVNSTAMILKLGLGFLQNGEFHDLGFR